MTKQVHDPVPALHAGAVHGAARDTLHEMKAVPGGPGIQHKFVDGREDYKDLDTCRKSGTWKCWHGDSALIEAGNVRCIVVGLAEDANGGQWLKRMIRPNHELMVPGP
jgi:beta-lactamase class A